MSEAEEQVLEHALREVLTEESSDLPLRVLHALREGEREHEAVEPRAPRWIVGTLATAAAMALLFWMLDRPSQAPWLAKSVGEVGVFPGDLAELEQQTSFGAGDTLVNGPLRDRDITLASGQSVTLGRCSMLALEWDERGPILTPRMGEVTVRGGSDSEVRVRTKLGTLAVGAAGEVQIDLRAEGDGLENPDQFQQLAKEIHMKSSTTLILTFVTVLHGTVLLESPAGAQPLAQGETLQEPEPKFTSKEVRDKLLRSVGVWELTMTRFDENGEPAETFDGEELCQAGPGDQWLITDMTLETGARTVKVHTVVGYDGGKRAYTGSLFDNFGGEIGLIKGTVGDDLESRTLQMYSALGTPGFDLRWRMKWRNPDERHTIIEVLEGDEWLRISEIVHRREREK